MSLTVTSWSSCLLFGCTHAAVTRCSILAPYLTVASSSSIKFKLKGCHFSYRFSTSQICLDV